MNKLKLWDPKFSFESYCEAWDEQEKVARNNHPLKLLKHLPKQVGITEETRHFLKLKSYIYLLWHKEGYQILKRFFKHPFSYTYQLLRSSLKKKPYKRDGDFFLYGVNSLNQFTQILREKESLLVVGFSYCHKPFECPSGRFSAECKNAKENLVCQQCFIGKVKHALPHHACIPLIIPTIHYIGTHLMDIVHNHPHKKIIFLITACELTLEMFGDWGNMVKVRGVGVRLDGRICNTMKAFELSEKGIKPGLTVLLEETKTTFLELIGKRREANHL